MARAAPTHSKPWGKRNGIREHWAQRGFSPVELLNLWEPTGAWEEYRGLAYGEGPRQRLDVYRPRHAKAPVLVFRSDAMRRRDANAKQLNVRMPPDELKSLDVWIKTQPAPRPTRAEAIRRLVGQALAGGAQPSQKRSKKSAAKAREMAGQAIVRLLGDAGSLPVDEQERRKRRLTKGPSEFCEIRGDLPKPKG